MLDSIEPYDIHFIQKASPTSNGDAFDFSYIYKFRTERTVKYQSLKYIIRVEAIGDLFAIKFYAARDGKLDNKYNRLIQAYNYSQTLRIFLTCASVVPLILSDHPFASLPSTKESNVEMGVISVEMTSVSSKHCSGPLFSTRSISISTTTASCSSLLFQGSEKKEKGRIRYS